MSIMKSVSAAQAQNVADEIGHLGGTKIGVRHDFEGVGLCEKRLQRFGCRAGLVGNIVEAGRIVGHKRPDLLIRRYDVTDVAFLHRRSAARLRIARCDAVWAVAAAAIVPPRITTTAVSRTSRISNLP